MKRRQFLHHSTLALAGWQALSPSAWAASLPSSTPASTQPRRLVVIMLRGAVDGLNVVAPYTDPHYVAMRPGIRLQPPGVDGGVLDLDGQFGLHPALSPLMPYWNRGNLSFVHAAGSNDTTRSHFDAQDYMESGTPGRKSTPDGWMNRLLGVMRGSDASSALSNSIRGISMGSSLPRIMSGAQTVTNLTSGKTATKATVLDKANVDAAFSQLYGGNDDLSRTYQIAGQSRKTVRTALTSSDNDKREMMIANNGAPLPHDGFIQDAASIATLLRREAQVQLVFMALGGWDTHINQGHASGLLANRLKPLGEGLSVMAEQLGDVFQDTMIVVMSEFGRTARQNGNAGTDHGHGNVMWLMSGGQLQGRRVHGTWPGLSPDALYEGRDLAVTTDFRDVLTQVLSQHLQIPPSAQSTVFPGFTPSTPSSLKLFT